MSFKKCKVVMLPTNEKASIGDIIGNNKGFTITDVSLSLNELSLIQAKVYKIYFLSDEPIKEGDWMLKKAAFNDGSAMIKQAEKGIDSKRMESLGCIKIIATTDKSLKVFIHTTMVIDMDDCYESLPQPSQSFIEKFVEEYNKGNVITEVMVEYEEPYSKLVGSKIGSNIGHFTLTEENKYRLKINPKDNTITIKKVKDSWSREEVKSLLECAWNGGAFWGTSKPNSTYFDKWIEENL